MSGKQDGPLAESRKRLMAIEKQKGVGELSQKILAELRRDARPSPERLRRQVTI